MSKLNCAWHMPIQRSVIFFFLFFFFFVQRMRLLQYATTTQDRKNQNGRSIREMSSEMGDNRGNFDLFRLNSSVRIKTRICAEVT